ncbi:hypothetical protein GCM10009430_38900 [Aquimarina litoralis]|uniref:GLPGLI family protein n=2 Tax=Aquimarina litoralis TaxID=584605 RepID=A0ABN1J575_9FLAO
MISQELSIVYEEKINNPNQSFTDDWYLDYDSGKSLYYPKDEIKDYEEPQTIEVEGEKYNITAKIFRNFDIVYFNQIDDIQISQLHASGEDYVVSEELKRYSWEILDQAKKIDSYNCRLATRIDEYGYEVKAWYTEDIPLSTGPAGYHGLPGLILELEYGFKHVTVKTISFEAKSKIVKPNKGTKMTREEYNALRGILMPKNSSETTVEQEGNTTITTTVIHEVKTTSAPKKKN